MNADFLKYANFVLSIISFNFVSELNCKHIIWFISILRENISFSSCSCKEQLAQTRFDPWLNELTSLRTHPNYYCVITDATKSGNESCYNECLHVRGITWLHGLHLTLHFQKNEFPSLLKLQLYSLQWLYALRIRYD